MNFYSIKDALHRNYTKAEDGSASSNPMTTNRAPLTRIVTLSTEQVQTPQDFLASFERLSEPVLSTSIDSLMTRKRNLFLIDG